MDSFTQITLGATVAEVGFRQKLGGRAVVWGGFCGLAPDLDIVLAVFDPWAEIVHHRGASHSFLVLLLVTPLFGWLGHRFGKKRGDWKTWTHLSFWSLITHPMLDVFTSFGTQVFWPLSDTRVAFDGASIVDLLYTLPQVAVLVLALRRGDPSRFRKRFAAGVLAATTLYLLVGTGFMHVAKSRAQDQLAQDGFNATEVRALPAIGTNLLFRIVARDDAEERRIGYVSLLHDGPVLFACVTSSDSSHARELMGSNHGQIVRWFSDGFFLVRESEDAVELIDLRFGTPRTPVNTLFGWSASTRDGLGELERLPRGTGEFGAELGSIWTAIWDGWEADCPE